jgi:hypothetical protein
VGRIADCYEGNFLFEIERAKKIYNISGSLQSAVYSQSTVRTVDCARCTLKKRRKGKGAGAQFVP